jgi:hypothetical protein
MESYITTAIDEGKYETLHPGKSKAELIETFLKTTNLWRWTCCGKKADELGCTTAYYHRYENVGGS